MAASSKSQQLISDQQLLAGFLKHLPNATITIQAEPETAAQVGAVIQVRIDKMQTVLAAKAAFHAAVVDASLEVASTESFVEDVRTAVLSMFSTSPPILADFGISPRKARAPMTTEQKLIAVAKREATRKARNTMGAKQKEKVVGTVTGSIMVPVDGSASSVVGSSASSASASPPPPAAPAAAPAVTTGH